VRGLITIRSPNALLKTQEGTIRLLQRSAKSALLPSARHLFQLSLGELWLRRLILATALQPKSPVLLKHEIDLFEELRAASAGLSLSIISESWRREIPPTSKEHDSGVQGGVSSANRAMPRMRTPYPATIKASLCAYRGSVGWVTTPPSTSEAGCGSEAEPCYSTST
jgi:hypothetical protein